MPCNTITQVRLELQNANIDLLKKALEGLGKLPVKDGEKRLYWQGGNYNKDTGKLTVLDQKFGETVKRAYSAEIVKAQAKRFGWQVKQTSEFKYQIIKR